MQSRLVQIIVTAACLWYSAPVWAQEPLSGNEVLARSIAYHDPQSSWPAFAVQLQIRQETARGSREDQVQIDIEGEHFRYSSTREGKTVLREYKQGSYTAAYDGDSDLSDSLRQAMRLSNEQIDRYRNYFIYLYGLPMKLKDPGLSIADQVERVTFYGRDALKVKVTYDPEVGEDIWYFYIDPSSYALVAYQFYHDEQANDGEYILLEGELSVGGYRIPKNRTWYKNSDNALLGTDYLQKANTIKP